VSPFRHSREISAAQPGLSTIQLDAAVLAHSRYDLADLRIVDGANLQIPYLLEKRGDVFATPLNSLLPESEAPPPRHSYHHLVLPFENLPGARLTFTTTEKVFQRSIQIKVKRAPDRRSEPAWESVAATTWIHNDGKSEPPPLVLDLPAALRTADILVDVEEGDNRPLPLGNFRIELPSYQLRFFHPGEGTLTLLYGNAALSAPRYDLELLAPQLAGTESRQLSLGDERSITAVPEENHAAAYVLWIALIVAVVAILGMLIRLLRAAPGTPTSD
jgi:hypothetical protein